MDSASWRARCAWAARLACSAAACLGRLPLLEGAGRELPVLLGLSRGRVGQRLGPGLGVGRGLVGLLGELRVPTGGLLRERARPGLLECGALQGAALLLGGGHERGVLVGGCGRCLGDLARAVLGAGALQERLLGEGGLLGGGLVGDPASLGVLEGGLLGCPALLERAGGEEGVVLRLPAGLLGGLTGPLLGRGRRLVGGAGGLGVPLRVLLGLLAGLRLGEGLGLGALPLLLGLADEGGVLVGLLGGRVGDLAGAVLGLGALQERLLGERGLRGGGLVGGTACLGGDGGGVLGGPAVVESDSCEGSVILGLCGGSLRRLPGPLLGRRGQGVSLLGHLRVPCGLLLGLQPSLGLLPGGPLEGLALALGLAHQRGVLVGRLGRLLGQLQRPLLGGGALGEGLLGDLGVVASRVLGVGAGQLGLLGEHRRLAGGLLGGLALGQGGDDALGQLGGVALRGLALGRLGLGQRDVLAGGALRGLAGAGGAVGQLLGLLPLPGRGLGGPLRLLARLVRGGGGVGVLLRESVGLGPGLDRLPGHLLGDEPFGGLFRGRELGVPAELDGLVGGPGIR